MVAVVSARGKTTDGLVALAQEISDRPDPREMDMLLSTGERISCALMAMALHDLGHDASSFTGSQAGIVTDDSHTKAKIVEIRADRAAEAIDEGTSCSSPASRACPRARRHDARPRRLRHDRGGAGRGARRRRLRDLHRRHGRLHGRPPHRAGARKLAAS